MRAFIRVVEAGSFAAAAEKLGTARSAVTKQVAALERHYGVRLLQRTTRRLSLTDAGRASFDRIQAILAEVDDLERALQAESRQPAGLLRVTAPFSFGTLHLGPAIADYLRLYPQVRIDLNLSDRRVDLVEEGFDLAVRIGWLADSSLVARQLAQIRMQLCASPDYLAARGVPLAPSDLRNHDCLNYTLSSTGDEWRFSDGAGEQTVRVAGRMQANNGDVLRSAALAGHGIILQPEFIVGEDVRAGRLVELLPQHAAAPAGLYAIYPTRRHLSAKVSTFVEHLAHCFAARPAASAV